MFPIEVAVINQAVFEMVRIELKQGAFEENLAHIGKISTVDTSSIMYWRMAEPISENLSNSWQAIKYLT